MYMTRRQPQRSGRWTARITAAAALLAAIACIGCGKKQPGATPAKKSTAPRWVGVTPPPKPAVRAKPVQPEPVQLSEVAPTEPSPPPQPPKQPEPPEPPEPPELPARPAEPVDHRAMAEAAMQRDDCREALRHIRLALADDSDSLAFRLRQARMCNRCNDPGQAIALLIDLDARTRATEPVAAEMAEAYFNLNEPRKAAMTWELRYIIDPSAWDAAAQAAIAWIEAGVSRPAQWWYQQARLAAPDSPEVQMLSTVLESPGDSRP